MNSDPNNVSVRSRLISMILDHIFMTIICLLFFIPSLIQDYNRFYTTQNLDSLLANPFFYLGLFGVALYYCKDSFNGRSLAKRIVKHQVIDSSTGKAASPLKCFVRNIFCIIWPIEIFVIFFSPGKRIGDRVAGTRVSLYDSKLMRSESFSFKKVGLSVILSYILVIVMASTFQLSRRSFPKIKYVESSYNERASQTLENVYRNMFQEYLSPDVKIYDSIENKNLKYVSVIFVFKNNSFSDGNKFNDIRNAAMRLLHNMFPENTFVGRAEYSYQTTNWRQKRIYKIGKEDIN